MCIFVLYYLISFVCKGWIRSLVPSTALSVEEEAWNAYPYTKTVRDDHTPFSKNALTPRRFCCLGFPILTFSLRADLSVPVPDFLPHRDRDKLHGRRGRAGQRVWPFIARAQGTRRRWAL